ncbi:MULTISPECIES: ABC transporter substrate-binding protein [Vitreoscilla]|uniref:ABC transporter substrate-binding protein n=1 Tax=Vitreoscilla stercoraria TaxID=61 RepID=A0ABY4EB66_VITST|nr:MULTISPECIES: ABC transporter substrate-binding protein [Vitreoscilla]QJQ52435.1 extracellular solute-binding protein [Vitreoscilla sp. C1]UOO92479.1 ABC transporter substrate-binding protein [Vitreoscilla stercoraria]
MKLTNLALVIGTLIVTAACGGEASLTGLDSDAPVPASKNITGEAYSGSERSASGERYLTVASWGGAYQDVQRKIFFQPFAQKLGTPVVDKSYDGGYDILKNQVAKGNPDWDLVQVEAEELALGCNEGLFEKLDWSKLGSPAKFVDGASSECGVGSIVWSTVLTYDGDKMAHGPKSWADFWDVKKFPGKRALRKGAKYNLEFALLSEGVPLNKVYPTLSTPEGVNRAFKRLEVLKPHIIWWEKGSQPLEYLAESRVVMASAYSGRIPALNAAEKRNFKMVWPESIYAIDSWVILKNASNKEAAMDLIAFTSEADNQSKLAANNIAYGLPNKEAAAKVPLEFAKLLPTTHANMRGTMPLDVDFWIKNAEVLNKRFNAWAAN